MGEEKRISGRVTIRTVAEDAGVSVAAVSKVLRNAYGVSDALRENVMETIARLGYRPSVAARGMRGQTYTIGILLVEIANPFVAEIIAGVNEVLQPSNYKALMGMGNSTTSIETSLIESMIDNRMDGLLLIAPRMAGKTLARFAQQIPMVVLGHHESSAAEFDTVNGDDEMGARLAVAALLEQGHRDIVMVSLDDADIAPENVVKARENGYFAAMQAAGLADAARIWRIARSTRPREMEIADLLARPDRPRAMFVWSDLDGVPILNQAVQAGIRVPQDLAIIGYDNTRVAALPLIGLASVEQNGKKLGELAMQSLLSRIGGRSAPHHILLEPGVVARPSLR